MRLNNVYEGLVTLLIALNAAAALPENSPIWNPADIITRDVCVIGGGASGTYAAIRLQEMNQSVLVVDRAARLGGHTETFTDPITQAKIDIGVLVWHNLDIVKNFFAKFDVPLITAEFSNAGNVQKFVDFRTGAIVSSYVPKDPSTVLGAYAAQIAKYPYLDTGFDLPNPVPTDLLLPFGDFVGKYNLSGLVNTIFEFNQGTGDFLSTTTLYVIKLFGLGVIQSLQTGFLTTARHDNSEIYEKAQANLSSSNSLLLSSQVLATECNESKDGYIEIVVSTPSGWKLVRTKKILLTIPPTLENLAPFELDSKQRSLFKQFNAPSGYYTGLIRNSGIPDNFLLTNIGANTSFNLPTLPGLYSIDPTGFPGILKVLYGSRTSIPSELVKKDIIASIKRLKPAGTLNATTPEFAVFASHSPFQFSVSAEAIKSGFYRQLSGLQGHRNMFFSGAAFHTQDSSLLWQFTESLLPSIVE
jgi:hypothetical protein